MSLNENADVDTSQVTDVRGSGGGGGGGFRMGGGLIGTLVTLALLVIGGITGVNVLGGGGGGDGSGDNSTVQQECATTNPDRTKNEDCRNILYINSIQAFWQTELPDVYSQPYQKVNTVFFSQAVNTGCGQADSGVGPFYCPEDKRVYIDLTFYDELASRFGAKGQFAQPYVLAHEYGHHVQDLLGTEADVNKQQQSDPGAANQLSVKLELQADCYAGVWAKHATETKTASGKPIFTSVTQQDLDQALQAAASIGDDKIQQQSGGRIDESKFTHGTAQQRHDWLLKGYTTGDPKACDTFS
ncbi:KPN_02809 family neutral zinc metallopeptidase [Hamadaea tsunoensis]|uniref:KPN_02809 family neutral zinc metallopeptidase n=1 Tax=Hamadaea tsunoensis TaxID=53368 RepID=UPI0003F66A1C|nr:neutral zinc metallopeptidase [Hamadaea tsunoensis]